MNRIKVKPINKEKAQNTFQLIQSDKIYSFLERYSVARVWFFAFLGYIILYVLVGLIVDHIYAGQRYMSIQNPAELLNGMNVWAIFLPMIWGLYRWMPGKTYKTITILENNCLIITEKPDYQSFEKLSQTIKKAYNNGFIDRLAFLGMVVTTGIFMIFCVPLQEKALGIKDFWYYTPVTTIIFTLIFAFSCYIIFLLVFRQIYVLWLIDNFFKQPGCIEKIYPHHPDKCGGFSDIGLLSTGMGLYVILVLVWALIYAYYYPIIAGGKPLWTTLIIVYIAYFLIVPILIIIPLWSPHQAMLRFKQTKLKDISTELLKLTSESINTIHLEDSTELCSDMDRIKKLEELYVFLDAQTPVWPVYFKSLRLFSIATSIPFVLSMVANVAELVNLINIK